MAASYYVAIYLLMTSLFGIQHRYDDIVEWYKGLEQKSDIVKFIPSIGKSVEGRDQPAVHITAVTDAAKKIYFQCQIHASKCLQ